MRHEKLNQRDKIDGLDVAAVWPASAQLSPLPVPDRLDVDAPQSPEEATPDVPVAAGMMIVGAYVTLVGALALATAVPGKSLFAIVIAFFFVTMFFAVPAAFLGIDARARTQLSLDRFLRDGMQTFNGHSSGGAALVQMLVVPVFLTLGVIGIGIAAALIF